MPKQENNEKLAFRRSDVPFQWRAYYDTFKIIDLKEGRLLMFGYSGIQKHIGTIPTIVSLLIDWGSLARVRDASTDYVKLLGLPTIRMEDLPEFPDGKAISPEYVNHIKVPHSMGMGELGFFSVSLHDIAIALAADTQGVIEVGSMPVAVFHADYPVHVLAVYEILNPVKS